ncbi:hypothetical protein BC826DRAFT_1013672 [Russula brevipes]|nr:hypothetical protein BC826DRAFT_1013672 [Russula brevipes]
MARTTKEPAQTTRTTEYQEKQRQEAERQPVASTSTATPGRPIKLLCWIHGISLDLFPVKIEDSETVGDLKNAIFLATSNVLPSINAHQLNLWKTTNIKDELDELEYRDEDMLAARLPLSHYFRPPEPTPYTPHIVAKVPDTYTSPKKRKYDEGDGQPPEVKRLMRAFSTAAPSSLAVPSLFSTITGREQIVAYNRPYDRETIPLVLLHEAFAIFEDRCQEEPSNKALFCLTELAPVACRQYDSEVTRRAKIRAVLERCMDLSLPEQTVPGTDYVTDGNLSVVVMPAAIRECKNEHGNALNQAIAYYGRFLKQAYRHSLRFNNYDTRFPSVLILDMGQYLGFCGAVWDGKQVRAEPLTPSSISAHTIASALDALVAAIKNIEAHYKAIDAAGKAKTASMKDGLRLQKARGFPFMSSYDEGRIAFTYNERLANDKLIFSATLNQHEVDESDEFLVKFSRRYSEAAHRYMASRDSAPKLRRCVQISKEWTAVIMDRSTYEVLFDLELTSENKEKVRSKVRRVVRLLHEGGFVHGDIRDTNILIDRGSLESEDVAIHLVDYDWAGRIGEAKYPVGINKLGVRRPHDVVGGQPITPIHDLEMVTLLFPTT